MTGKKRELSGVLTPMVTPFKGDRVMFHGLIANVEKMNETALAGYFVLGTNGEYKSLSVGERVEVLRTVVKYRAKGKVVMAGTGFESTKETIDMTLRAADEGADMASLLMPHFFPKKMTPEVLAGFITEVADASPIPVLLYNNPSVASGVTIKADLIRLVKDHPNVIGMKDSSHDTYRENLEAAKGGMCVLAGSANYFLDLLRAGGTGGVLSLANVFPDACARLYTLFREGKTGGGRGAERGADRAEQGGVRFVRRGRGEGGDGSGRILRRGPPEAPSAAHRGAAGNIEGLPRQEQVQVRTWRRRKKRRHPGESRIGVRDRRRYPVLLQAIPWISWHTRNDKKGESTFTGSA